MEGGKPKRKFKACPIGYFHIDIAEVRSEEGKIYLFAAIDRPSKFAFVELHRKAGKMAAAQFPGNLVAALPYRIHAVLTGLPMAGPPVRAAIVDGGQFANRQQDRPAMARIFGRACEENAIQRRLTKINHPWTNGQVERMSRMINEATVKRYHCGTHAELEGHLAAFIAACNCARRLKTLRGPTPFEFICGKWTKEPDRFKADPTRHTPGLNT